MTHLDLKNYLDEIIKEVESIKVSDPEISLQLLHLSHMILIKVREGRLERGLARL